LHQRIIIPSVFQLGPNNGVNLPTSNKPLSGGGVDISQCFLKKQVVRTDKSRVSENYLKGIQKSGEVRNTCLLAFVTTCQVASLAHSVEAFPTLQLKLIRGRRKWVSALLQRLKGIEQNATQSRQSPDLYLGNFACRT